MDNKEKLEEAKRLYETANADQRYVLESLFPELMESEDERIRKELIAHFKTNSVSESWSGLNVKKVIAWLEKQGEKTNPYSGISFEYNGHIWGMCARDNGVDILLDKQLFKHLEKQCEQKPADKVEPKFKVGDKVLINGKVCTIKLVNEDNYIVNENGRNVQEHFSYAKDWKLIRQSSILSEEDVTGLNDALWAIKQARTVAKDENDMDNLLYAENWLKDRVQTLLKQEWSGGDEAMWAEISDLLWEGYKQSGSKFSWDDIRNWLNPKLKSLKPQNQKQWKPSDYELEVLKLAAEKDGTCLMGLYKQLKKLRED